MRVALMTCHPSERLLLPQFRSIPLYSKSWAVLGFTEREVSSELSGDAQSNMGNLQFVFPHIHAAEAPLNLYAVLFSATSFSSFFLWSKKKIITNIFLYNT